LESISLKEVYEGFRADIPLSELEKGKLYFAGRKTKALDGEDKALILSQHPTVKGKGDIQQRYENVNPIFVKMKIILGEESAQKL